MAADALVSPSGRRGSRGSSSETAATPVARHRLDVLGTSVADVVSSAGGWLADRALAGWDVNVFVPEDDGSAALRILGVSIHQLSELSAERADSHGPTAIAVSAGVLCADARVRARLTAECKRDIAEVTVWGDLEPATVDANLYAVQHVPSRAARAFKSHALQAAAIDPVDPEAAEVFHSGRPVRERRRLAAVTVDSPAIAAAAVWAPVEQRRNA
jgi:hypothetical protein